MRQQQIILDGNAWVRVATGVRYPFSPTTRRVAYLLCRAGADPLPKGWKVSTRYIVRAPNGDTIELLDNMEDAMTRLSMEFLLKRQPKEQNEPDST